MIYLICALLSLPVFACKMTPEGAKRRAESAALEVVSKKTGHKNLKAWQKDLHWLVRTTKLNCVEYKVEINYGKGDCKTTGKILSERNCP